MSLEIDLLLLVCGKLNLVNIPYMLTGSFAANFYAVPRMTRDIDIVIEIGLPHVDKIVKLFQNDFYIDRESIQEAIKYQSMFNIIHNDSAFKIDFIIRKEDAYRETEFERRRQVKFNQGFISVVAPEDLILSKLFWAKDSFSEMQLKDVKNLLSSIKDLDNDYIDKWIKILALNQIYEKAKSDE